MALLLPDHSYLRTWPLSAAHEKQKAGPGPTRLLRASSRSGPAEMAPPALRSMFSPLSHSGRGRRLSAGPGAWLRVPGPDHVKRKCSFGCRSPWLISAWLIIHSHSLSAGSWAEATFRIKSLLLYSRKISTCRTGGLGLTVAIRGPCAACKTQDCVFILCLHLLGGRGRGGGCC